MCVVLGCRYENEKETWTGTGTGTGSGRKDVVLVFVLIILCVVRLTDTAPAKLKLFREDGGKAFELTSRKCKAGVFLLEPTQYSCACITGVWGFYTKYCKTPFLIVGGDNYCFKLDSAKISQVILFGNSRYPFEKSLTHFREGFSIMTKAFVTDDDTTDLDAASTFLGISSKPWTITANTGDTLCLIPNKQIDPSKRQFCLFDVARGATTDWKEIIEIRRGCWSKKVIEADDCEEIHPPNDEAACQSSGVEATTKSPSGTTDISEPTTDVPKSSSTPLPLSTSEPPDVCLGSFTMKDVTAYWGSAQQSNCPTSITELLFTDQLKRFAVLQMNQVIRTRQVSLEQTEELLQIQVDIFKVTCPPQVVPPEFIDVVAEAFAMFVRDDFFYGVEETETSLYETIVYNLRTCLKRATPFDFILDPAKQCNDTQVIRQVVVNGVAQDIKIDPSNSWRNYEIIIEAVWKIFMSAHSFCFEDFLRQNDHHVFAVRMMKLFSVSIYEKWIQPLSSRALYKFILPNANLLEVTMDNLDRCVGALAFHEPCPVLLDRAYLPPAANSPLISSRGISKLQARNAAEQLSENNSQDFPQQLPNPENLQELYDWEKLGWNHPPEEKMLQQGTGKEALVSNNLDELTRSRRKSVKKKKKRSIWMDHFQGNRDATQIWNGSAHCLETPEDPGFFLGFGRCAHP